LQAGGGVSYLSKKHISVGLAIDLPTPIAKLDKQVLPFLDSILLMSVKAGRSGQQFDPQVIGKIKQLRGICGKHTEIIVDGGINLETGRLCLKSGASCLAVNSFLWENPEKHWVLLSHLG
jgi:ribulose-phosphate 3-epimerase